MATTDVLATLNISVSELPQKCRQLLQQVCTAHVLSGLNQFDPGVISLLQSREIADELDDEYEILKLRQKNQELEVKMNRNSELLKQLKSELVRSREILSKQTPNPGNVQEYCQQMRRKLATYEEGYERMKARFAKLSVPKEIMPKELDKLVASHNKLKEKASNLRYRVEDIELERTTRDALRKTYLSLGESSLRKTRRE